MESSGDDRHSMLRASRSHSSHQRRQRSLREGSMPRASSPVSSSGIKRRSPSTGATIMPSPTVRKSVSRSTILTEGLWDQSSQQHRWSVWTCNTDPTEVSSPHLEIDIDAGLKPIAGSAPESSYAAASRSERENSAEYSISETSDGDKFSRSGFDEESHDRWEQRVADGRSVRSHSPMLSPPSPTSEGALDAALSSTMLALTTANSLLLSTMASRQELARMRALQNEMDDSLNRREQELRRRLEENNKTIAWMDQACQRLDDVLQGRNPRSLAADRSELSELATIVTQQEAQRPALSPMPQSINAAPLSPRPKLVLSSSFAHASIQRDAGREDGKASSNTSRPLVHDRTKIDESDAPSSNASAAHHLEQVLRRHEPLQAQENVQKGPNNSSGAIPAAKQSNSKQLPLRLQSTPAYAAPTSTVQASTSRANDASSGASGHQQSASALLTAALGSNRGGTADTVASPPAEAVSIQPQEEPLPANAAIADANPEVLDSTLRGALSQHRTPSALRVAQDTQGSGSTLTNAAHSWRGDGGAYYSPDRDSNSNISPDGVPRARRKGALEALRQLNSGSHTERDVNSSGPHGLGSTPTDRHTGTSSGWGGTIASWIGLPGRGEISERTPIGASGPEQEEGKSNVSRGVEAVDASTKILNKDG